MLKTKETKRERNRKEIESDSNVHPSFSQDFDKTALWPDSNSEVSRLIYLRRRLITDASCIQTPYYVISRCFKERREDSIMQACESRIRDVHAVVDTSYLKLTTMRILLLKQNPFENKVRSNEPLHYLPSTSALPNYPGPYHPRLLGNVY